VKEGILDLKNWLMGKDPLDIEALYTHMGRGTQIFQAQGPKDRRISRSGQ
jgi:hypothetical protein